MLIKFFKSDRKMQLKTSRIKFQSLPSTMSCKSLSATLRVYKGSKIAKEKKFSLAKWH